MLACALLLAAAARADTKAFLRITGPSANAYHVSGAQTIVLEGETTASYFTELEFLVSLSGATTADFSDDPDFVSYDATSGHWWSKPIRLDPGVSTVTCTLRGHTPFYGEPMELTDTIQIHRSTLVCDIGIYNSATGQPVFYENNTQQISLRAFHTSGERVDVYVVLLAPYNRFYCMGADFEWRWPDTILPILADWEATDLRDPAEFLMKTVDILGGTYQWVFLFTTAGSDPTDPRNWIAWDTAEWQFVTDD